MSETLDGRLVVAVSSRALFDFEEENIVFENKSELDYRELQISRMDLPAKKGVAFPLVEKLMSFNEEGHEPMVEVVILSRNDPFSGMRTFRSSEYYKLGILRGVFTKGRAPWRYLSPLSAHLFLSAHAEDVYAAMSAGVLATRLIPWSQHAKETHPNEIRIAFDGDAVLFSDEAEKIYQKHGKEVFVEHEIAHAKSPLPPGPLKPLLYSLNQLQKSQKSKMQIRTALITSRSSKAHERAINTLIGWNIEIDEAMFLGGLNKSRFLREFEADIFFDDQWGNIQSAALYVPSAQVIPK